MKAIVRGQRGRILGNYARLFGGLHWAGVNTGVISAAVPITYATLTGGMDYQAGNPLTYDGFFQVVATDAAGNFAEANVVVQLAGEVAADGSCTHNALTPSFAGSVPETAAVGTQVVQVTENLAGDKTFTLWFGDINGVGANVFAVDAVTGWVTVAGPIDAQAKGSYHLQVQITDNAGLWYVVEVLVTVTAANQPPTDIALTPATVAELPAGATVGTLTATDPDGDAVTFSIAAGAVGADKFVVDGNTLKGINRFQFDAGETSADVAITATDATGLTFTKTFTVAITGVNEPPFDLKLQAGANDAAPVLAFSESLLVASDLGVIVASDPEGNAVDCQVVSTTPAGPNGALLFVLHNANVLQLSYAVDFEATPTVSFVVQCTDNQAANFLSAPATFTLQVENANDAPALVLNQPAAVDENQIGNVAIGTLVASDPDSASVTFVIFDASFTLGETNCELVGAGSQCSATLTAVAPLDYETPTPGQTLVEVLVTDNSGLATSSFASRLMGECRAL
jgi:hypothetical protein